jgi:hypothetical protein
MRHVMHPVRSTNACDASDDAEGFGTPHTGLSQRSMKTIGGSRGEKKYEYTLAAMYSYP